VAGGQHAHDFGEREPDGVGILKGPHRKAAYASELGRELSVRNDIRPVENRPSQPWNGFSTGMSAR
jgi:hypothetical protein